MILYLLFFFQLGLFAITLDYSCDWSVVGLFVLRVLFGDTGVVRFRLRFILGVTYFVWFVFRVY